MGESQGLRALLVLGGGRLGALSLAHVRETMRRQPTEPLPNAPQFVLGVALIRGTLAPVVDLALLLGGEPGQSRRFVLLAVAERSVALAVDTVLGVHTLPAASISDLPPLLQSAEPGAIDRLGTHDRKLLTVLETARLVPDELWGALAAREGRA